MFGDSTTNLPSSMLTPDWATSELGWDEFYEKWLHLKAAANL